MNKGTMKSFQDLFQRYKYYDDVDWYKSKTCLDYDSINDIIKYGFGWNNCRYQPIFEYFKS